MNECVISMGRVNGIPSRVISSLLRVRIVVIASLCIFRMFICTHFLDVYFMLF